MKLTELKITIGELKPNPLKVVAQASVESLKRGQDPSSAHEFKF
jgi:hypothetical protein